MWYKQPTFFEKCDLIKIAFLFCDHSDYLLPAWYNALVFFALFAKSLFDFPAHHRRTTYPIPARFTIVVKILVPIHSGIGFQRPAAQAKSL